MNTLEHADGPAPDLIVPLVGFRQWRLANGVLTSMYDRAAWPQDGVTASCDRGHSSAEVPAKDCRKTLTRAANVWARNGPV